MIVIPRSAWRKWITPSGKEMVFMTCPKCGNEARVLGGNTSHTIAIDGKISPSVVCPAGSVDRLKEDQCDFHEFCTLEGWTVTA